jgi:predicted phage terminase large subunit-like protein
MQRLHTDDMAAKWIAEKPGLVKVVIPRVAVARQVITYPISGDVVVRESGGLLNPERVGAVELAAQKRSYGTYAFEAQQQQEPVPIGGGRIKKDWFKGRYNRLPDTFEQVVQSYDTASKAAQINNPSVCLTFGLKSAKWYLADVWKGRVTSPQLREMVKINAGTWHPTTILIEDKSSGSGLIQDLQADKDFKIKPLAVQPHGEKMIRMDNQTPKLEAGLVVLPAVELQLPWLPDLERDLFSFPDCVEWDAIDALSQFLDWAYKAKKDFNFSLSLGDTSGKNKWRGDS